MNALNRFILSDKYIMSYKRLPKEIFNYCIKPFIIPKQSISMIKENGKKKIISKIFY